MSECKIKIGDTFGRLTVLRCLGVIPWQKGANKTVFELRCACGRRTKQSCAELNSGFARSCGCVRRKMFAIQIRKEERGNRVRHVQSPLSQPESLRPENLPKRPPRAKVDE